MAMGPATVLVVVVAIAAMAMTVCEGKIKKRNIEVPLDMNLKSAENMMVRRISELVDEQPQLVRTKRFKRDIHEPVLRRVKRSGGSADEVPVDLVKRVKRFADQQLKRVKRIDEIYQPDLIRYKRFKRAVNVNTQNIKDMRRLKRANKNIISSMTPFDLPTIKRAKRAGPKPVDKNLKKHMYLRKKRKQPSEMSDSSKLGELVKKAVEKVKRSKRNSKHISKLHRAKRGGGPTARINKRAVVLKDITRDITRLQRLRRGIAHEVIRDSKLQSKAKNHYIVKRNENVAMKRKHHK